MTEAITSSGKAGEEPGGRLSQPDARWLRGIQSEFVDCFTTLDDVRPAVTVFGSARTVPGTDEYKLGADIGAGLAAAGFTVVTGGGPGAMEAANLGASSVGGRSVGVGIELPREQQFNDFLGIRVQCGHFFTRKVTFVKYTSATVALPGGFGTLDELFEVVTLVQTGKLEERPIVLVGTWFWEGLLSWIREVMLRSGKISPEDLRLLPVVDTADEAVELVKRAVS